MRPQRILLLLLPLLLAVARAGHLRSGGAEAGAEAATEESAAAATATPSKDLLAKTLLSMADKLEGKGAAAGTESSAAAGGDPAHAAFEDAVLQAVKVLGKHQQTKVTLEQVAAAMRKNEATGSEAGGKVGKVTVGQIVAALRLAPLKPKEAPVDKKKLLATAVGAVEAKLDQLAEMLANAKAEDPVEKTPEELASHDMQHGLATTPPPALPAPINFRLNMEHPVLPQDQ
jgi:hypothetical protein